MQIDSGAMITPILRRDKKMWQSLDTWEKECQVANSNHPITQSTSSALQKVRRKPSRTSSLVLYPSHKHRPTYDYESIVNKMLGKKHAVKPKSKPDRVKCSNQYAQTDHIVTEPTKKYMNQFTQTKPSELQENPVLYEQGDTHRPRHSYRIFTPASSRRVKYRNRYINIDNPLGGAKGTSVTAMSGETGSDEASEGNQSVPTHRVDAIYNETYPTTPLDIPHDTLHDTEHSIDPIDEGSGPSRMLEKQATTEPTTSHYRKKMPKFTQHKRKYDVKVKDSNLNIKASGRYRSKSDPLIQSVSYEI